MTWDKFEELWQALWKYLYKVFDFLAKKGAPAEEEKTEA